MWHLHHQQRKEIVHENSITEPMNIKLNHIFKENSSYQALFYSLLLSAIGFGLYKGVIDNYMAEVVQMNELDCGVT